MADGGSAPPVVNYFAIGSMMNPICMANRGIQPVSTSQPAELLDYRLEFFSDFGFADAVPSAGSSFHGVIHKVHDSDMAKLDKIELHYKRQTATARLYDGTLTPVQVYSNERRRRGDLHAPGERYLKVLMEGAEHHGVDKSYVEWLGNHEKIPRPSGDNLLTLEKSCCCKDDNLKEVSIQDVMRNDGNDGRPFWISANGKVLEANFPPDQMHSLDLYKGHSQASGHQIMELHYGKLLYDPKYGTISTMEDVVPDYAEWCEHFLVKHLTSTKHLKYFKIVATLVT